MIIETYPTTDLYLAAYLLCVGIPLDDAHREDRTTTFHFLEPDRARELSRRFQLGQGDEVSASLYAASAQRAKRIAVGGL